MVFAKPRCHCRIRKRNSDDLCPPVPEESTLAEHGAASCCTGQSYKYLAAGGLHFSNHKFSPQVCENGRRAEDMCVRSWRRKVLAFLT